MEPNTVSVVAISISYIFGMGLFAGVVKSSLTSVRKDITRLEDKQDKHNGLIERMVVVEQSVKSSHKRLDDINKE